MKGLSAGSEKLVFTIKALWGDMLMKNHILKTVLLSVVFVLLLTFSACAEDYEEKFNAMELDELQKISEILANVINEKKIGSAVLFADPAEKTLAKGKTLKLTVSSDGREVTAKTVLTYESSDESVAKVVKGTVTGVGEGTAIIKVSARFEDGAVLETSSTVNVFVPVTALKAPLKANAFVGGEINLADTVSIAPENATEKKLIYSIDDESVATVDENGILKGLKGGSAKVTIESAQTEPAVKKLQVTVTVNEAVGSIRLDKTSFELGKGKTLKLTATVGPESATNKAVEWKAEDTKIAMVSAAGVVTGKANGTTRITCTAKDGSGVVAYADVKVITAVSSVKMTKTTIAVMEGETAFAYWDILPKDATYKSVTWKSSDTRVVSVDTAGRMTAKKAGTATVTATSKSDRTKSASVKVYVEPKSPVTVNTIHWQTTWGQRNGKMGVMVLNLCNYHKIKSVTVEVVCTTWYGNTVTDYVTYSGLMIYPGKEGKTKLTSSSVSGFSTAASVRITPISVTFEDGTEYTIPKTERDTSNFSL